MPGPAPASVMPGDLVDPAAAAAVVREGALLIDIREGYERDLLRVSGARHVPLFDILRNEEAVPRGGTLLVLDHDGSRGAFGARVLRERGHDALAVEGGARALAGRS